MRAAKFGLIVALAISCSPVPAVFADLRYETKIIGIGASDLADLVAEVSQLTTLEDRPPASGEALRRRAEDDLDRLKDAAHSLGYWSAQFAYEIDTGADPTTVTVTATPGPLYHVASVEVRGAKGHPLAVRIDQCARQLALKPRDPARATFVIDTENALLALLGHAGYPFAKAAERRVVVDHDTHTMN